MMRTDLNAARAMELEMKAHLVKAKELAQNIIDQRDTEYNSGDVTMCDYFPDGKHSAWQYIWECTVRLKSLQFTEQSLLAQTGSVDWEKVVHVRSVIVDKCLDLINYAAIMFALHMLEEVGVQQQSEESGDEKEAG